MLRLLCGGTRKDAIMNEDIRENSWVAPIDYKIKEMSSTTMIAQHLLRISK